jgi:diguanylate cyclase (GGDEF)-like protein
MHEFELAKRTVVLSKYTALVIVSSLAALALTIGISGTTAAVGTRTLGFAFIIASYLTACLLVYRRQTRHLVDEARSVFESSIDRVLHELDETNLLIAGSLKVRDMFRLAASRIDHLVGCSASKLLLMDETRSGLRIAASSGKWPEASEVEKGGVNDALATRCMSERSVVTVVPCGLPATVAIPLIRGVETFGVLQLFFDREPNRPLDEMQELFEAIGDRVSPLVLSSIIFERNQERAMTDTMTDLPNERGFHLILEQQIAEAAREQDARLLSLVAINIEDFDHINSSRGRAWGDGVLNFVARAAQENLRQMDFVARCANDEFVAVLPTASEKIALEIISRIENAIGGRKVEIPGIEPFEVRLNFGWAVFGRDGETAKALLAAARARRDLSANDHRRGTVLLFHK